MKNTKVDLTDLDRTLNKRIFRLADVQDRIEKIAFDVVRFQDGDIDDLWQVQSHADGDYIVSMYPESEEDTTVKTAAVKTASNWEVILNKSGQDLNFFYKGEPIVKIAASKLGIAAEDIAVTKRFLPSKLASNKTLVSALLKELDLTTRISVTRKFPELA